MYETGLGVPQNYAEAVKWFRKGAEQGYARAQNNLGVMYATGHGVANNYEEALKWFRKSAEQAEPYPDATNTLGLMFERGMGVTPDLVQAYLWYSLAVEQGNEFSRSNLASLAKRMTPAQVAEAQKQFEQKKARPRP